MSNTLRVTTRAVSFRGRSTGQSVLESESLIRSLHVIRDHSQESNTRNNIQRLIDMIYDVKPSV